MVETLFGSDALFGLVRMSVPVLLVSAGGFVMLVSGIMNVALEGLLLLGCLMGVGISLAFSNVLIGSLVTIVVIVSINLVYTFLVVRFGIDSTVLGIGIGILAAGVGTFTYQSSGGEMNILRAGLARIPKIKIPFLDSVPYLGEVLSGHSLIVYLAFALVALVWLVVYKMPIGYYMRAAGDNPVALETAGVSPRKMKYISAIIAGSLIAVAGLYLSLGYSSQFTPDMSGGRGWIAIAIMFVAGKRYGAVITTSIIFALAETLAFRLQLFGFSSYSTLLIPYVTVVVLMLLVNVIHGRYLHQRHLSS